MSVMGDVFIGSEAITAGRLTRHELQRWYQPMFRGVYVSRRSVPSAHTLGSHGWRLASHEAPWRHSW